jgi:hypothetical protein
VSRLAAETPFDRADPLILGRDLAHTRGPMARPASRSPREGVVERTKGFKRAWKARRYAGDAGEGAASIVTLVLAEEWSPGASTHHLLPC